MNELIIILFIYFIINAFMSGVTYDESPKFMIPIIFLFGIIIFVGHYILAFFIAMWWLFLNYTGLSFWYYFYFTKRYKNLPIDQLEVLNINSRKRNRFKGDFEYKIVAKWISKINKRHNYTYNNPTS